MSLMVFPFHTCTCDTLALAAAKKWQDPDRRGSGQGSSKRAKTQDGGDSLVSPGSGSSPAVAASAGWMSLAGVRAPSSALARLQVEGSVLGDDDDAGTEAAGGAATARGTLRREEAKKQKKTLANGALA